MLVEQIECADFIVLNKKDKCNAEQMETLHGIICIHTYIHTYIPTHTHTYIHTYVYIYHRENINPRWD